MLSAGETSQPKERVGADLMTCDREPIHIPGSIQPHGVLLVLHEDDLTLLQVSENVGTWLGTPASEALGRSLSELLGAEIAERLGADLRQTPETSRPVFLRTLELTASGTTHRFHAVAHRTADGILLELELSLGAGADAVPDAHPLLDAFTLRAEAAADLEALSLLTAEQVRRITGFDRVLIYRFDERWNGIVIGEDGSGRLPSYLHHRFPATDIPAQARELYRTNRLRIIPDAGYRPVPGTPPLSPRSGRPLDLSFSTLRSVSPVHVQYMRNMETASSMSVSILRDGQLWGLISCHHREPRTVPFPVRALCDLFGRVFSLRLAALAHTKDYQRRIEVKAAYARLVAGMTDRGDFTAALCEHERSLLSFVDAAGAAILTQSGCLLLGTTPGEAQVRALAGWLFEDVKDEVYATDSLPAVYPASREYPAREYPAREYPAREYPAREYKDRACGLLAIAVSKLHPSYVLWFRPEVLQTIRWGGDPRKSPELGGPGDPRGVLHPRRSFATWMETVREKSLPWQPSEIEGATELRNTIVGTVLRKAEELASLNAELVRSNKELESFSYSVSHDLRAPLRHIAGYAAILRENGSGKLTEKEARYINTIIESSDYAGKLVDKLLGFSRLGRAELQRVRVNMTTLVRETQHDVMQDAPDRKITWNIAEMPTVSVDLMMIRMAVRDLLSNAVKYTRQKEEALIEIGARDEGSEYVFFVRDNGVGFDMEYSDKLFGVFQRLHRWEDYEGTGIGLANVRRVIERHGGRTWAEGEEGKGATFYFTLPKPKSEVE
jgi:light-regulated signal transduction histidine kinase (bacteriophytochrome)